MFDNKVGKIGVVKSKFGFHVIRIDDQKNRQKVVKMITFGREIIPSLDTENAVFQKAEQFALDLASKESNFYDVAKKSNYQTKPAIGLKIMDDKVPGLPATQRPIVTWSFGRDAKVGDVQRFDVDKGYVVAILTGKTNKGLLSSSKAINRVRPILLNDKKAELIKEKMVGSSLNDIATANNVVIKKADNVSLKSPSIAGVGFEPKIVGAMQRAKENQFYNKVAGDRGVYAFVVNKKEKAIVLPNYEVYRKVISEDRKASISKIFEALKKTSEVEDSRAAFHGVQ